MVSQPSAKSACLKSSAKAKRVSLPSLGFLRSFNWQSIPNAIVFDDPVSSLDHEFTAKIAARLAREGLTRQVIAFTHNIAFLMELQDASEALAWAGLPLLSLFTRSAVMQKRLASPQMGRLGMP